MQQSELLTEYELEYAGEIANQVISIEDLKKCGISEKTLASELYLRKIYGDEIVKKTIIDDVDDKKEKAVIKIGMDEKNMDHELRSIFNEIENSEFDKNIDAILK